LGLGLRSHAALRSISQVRVEQDGLSRMVCWGVIHRISERIIRTFESGAWAIRVDFDPRPSGCRLPIHFTCTITPSCPVASPPSPS
jgi:hypothetical protein